MLNRPIPDPHRAGSGLAGSSNDAWDARPVEPSGWDAFGFLWRRKFRILAVAAVAMTAATVVTAALPKDFVAATSVIYQGDAPAALAREERAEPAFAADTLSSEVELLTSEQLLTKVATTLGLERAPEFAPRRDSPLPAWLSSIIGRTSAPAPSDTEAALTETVDTLRTKLSIAPVGLSRVIRIAAKSHDPALAARIANAVAQAYVQARIDAKAAATKQAHQWIEQRLSALRDRALETAKAYDDYRARAGAVRGKDGPIAQEQLTQISAELAQARQLESTIQLALADASNGAGSDLDTLTAASGSPLLPKLRDQLAAATAHQAEMEVTRGKSAPSVIANRALVADLSRSIGAERSRIRHTLETKLAVLRSTETQLAATLASQVAKVEQSDSSGAQMQALERDATASADTYRSFRLHAEQTDPELSYQAPGVRILSEAVAPVRPSSPNKRVILPAAFVASLGLGVAVAFLSETRRRGILSLRDLPRPAGQLPLGSLPLLRRQDRKMSRVWDEAVAQILARMLLPADGRAPVSILVTSAAPREGKTRLAIALAKAAQDRGLRVLLVDADLRGRGASKAAGLSQSDQNLARLLHGEIRAEEAGIRHQEWGFSVLPAGICSESPVTLLVSNAFPAALQHFRSRFDLVVIDTPPVLVAADAWLLARHADATAIAVESGVTEPAVVAEVVERMVGTDARVLGLVLTKVDAHAHVDPAELTMLSPKLLSYHDRRPAIAIAAAAPDQPGMRRSVSRAAFWAAAETGGAQAAAFLFFVVFARLLSPNEFGVYALAMAIVGFVNMILFQGFGDGLIQAEEVDDDAVDTAFWTNMALGVAMVGALQLFALAAPVLFDNVQLGPVISWLSLLCLPRALVSIHSAIFRRSLDLRVFAIRTVIGSVAGGAVGVVLAVLGYGVWALVIAQFVQSILVAAIMWNATPWRPRFTFSAAAFRRLLAFSRNFMAASVISSCIDDVASLIVGLTMDFTAVGYFSVALRVLRAVIILVMTPLQIVMMPALSRIAHDKPRFGAGYSDMVILTSMVWLPLVAGLGLAAPVLIPLVFGAQWEGAVPIVSAMSFVALTMPLWTFSGQAMTALGRPDAFAGMAYWQLGLYGVAFVLVAPFGIVAIGWTWAALSAAMVPVSLLRLRRLAELDVGSLLRRSCRVAVAGAAMVATGLLVRSALPPSGWSLVPMGLAACAAYATALAVVLPGHITHFAGSVRDALPRRQMRETAA